MARISTGARRQSIQVARQQRTKRRGAKKTLACDEYFELNGRTKSKWLFAPNRQNAIKGAREQAEEKADAEIAVAVDKIAKKWKCDDECPEMVVTVTFETSARCRPGFDPDPTGGNGFEAKATCNWTAIIECESADE